MELKGGYKQTDLGVIPESWGMSSIAELSSQIIDYRGRTPKKLGMEWGGGDIAALSAGNVKNGYIDFSAECYFASEELYRRWMTKGDVKKGDLLFTTEAPLGNVALVPDEKRYILSQRTILIQVKYERVSSQFIFQMLLSDWFKKILEDNSSGSTAKGIQRRKFETLCLPLPPLNEQEAIAKALSDVDALIAGLEKLIAKKRDLKQAAMQQLLTGQTRLPGFSGKWARNELKNLVSTPITDGPHLTPTFYETGVPFLSVNNLANNRIDLSDLRFISKADDEIFSRKCKPRKGDVLLGKAASVGKVAIVEDDFDFNIWSPIALIRSSAQVDAKFLYYQLLSADCITQVMLLTNSSSQGNIGMGDIEKIQISYPSLEEQIAIAKVLSDMDDELTILTSRITKTRDLKQGMMQELLTGRTRLV